MKRPISSKDSTGYIYIFGLTGEAGVVRFLRGLQSPNSRSPQTLPQSRPIGQCEEKAGSMDETVSFEPPEAHKKNFGCKLSSVR